MTLPACRSGSLASLPARLGRRHPLMMTAMATMMRPDMMNTVTPMTPSVPHSGAVPM